MFCSCNTFCTKGALKARRDLIKNAIIEWWVENTPPDGAKAEGAKAADGENKTKAKEEKSSTAKEAKEAKDAKGSKETKAKETKAKETKAKETKAESIVLQRLQKLAHVMNVIFLFHVCYSF